MTGQAYQDPKDALNEFVSNAADEYSEAEMRGGSIRIMQRRRGRYPMLAIDDAGRGMDAARLRAIAGSLFDSTKAGDPRTPGHPSSTDKMFPAGALNQAMVGPPPRAMPFSSVEMSPS